MFKLSGQSIKVLKGENTFLSLAEKNGLVCVLVETALLEGKPRVRREADRGSRRRPRQERQSLKHAGLLGQPSSIHSYAWSHRNDFAEQISLSKPLG